MRTKELKTRNERGVTLIALVVTIIVLLILAGVSIATLTGQNGLIAKAKQASLNTEEAQAREESDLDYIGDYIDRIANENKGLDTVTGDETKNSTVYDKFGNKVVVPAGFKIINPEDDVTKGIIIEDVSAGNTISKGNQFVWIPIGNIYLDIKNTDEDRTKIILGRYEFNSTQGEHYGEATLIQPAEEWSDNSDKVLIDPCYKELENSSYGNVSSKSLENFISKALKSGGYYVGRYESGDGEATETERTSQTSDSNQMVSKERVYPYTWITQSIASNLSQKMYNTDNFESDLINSYAWDTAMVFIQKFSGDKAYSMQSSAYDKVVGCGEIHSEGKSDVKCNIYDMAGNTREWSTETSSHLEYQYPCVGRGGTWQGDYAGLRYSLATNVSSGDISARPVLYL